MIRSDNALIPLADISPALLLLPPPEYSEISPLLIITFVSAVIASPPEVIFNEQSSIIMYPFVASSALSDFRPSPPAFIVIVAFFMTI